MNSRKDPVGSLHASIRKRNNGFHLKPRRNAEPFRPTTNLTPRTFFFFFFFWLGQTRNDGKSWSFPSYGFCVLLLRLLVGAGVGVMD